LPAFAPRRDFFLAAVFDPDLDFVAAFFAFALDDFFALDLDLDFLAMQFLRRECWQSIGLDRSNKPSLFFDLSNKSRAGLALIHATGSNDLFDVIVSAP
jgi:hypothetical protein